MFRLSTCAVVLLVLTAQSAWGDSYTLTIVTEKGTAITASQDWSRRLAEAGITSVRVRGAKPGDKAEIEEVDAGRGKVYRVIGVLNRSDKLVLPGATFTLRDTAKLKDYLNHVLADGKEAVTAERGQYGLTKKQFEQVFTALGRPVDFETKDQSLAALAEQVSKRTKMSVEVDAGLRPTFRRLSCRDDLRTLSLGCGLAIALKAEGLAVAPEKPRGKPVQLAIRFAQAKQQAWPIGWPSKARLSQLAPVMLKKTKVEIDGFSLTEVVDAIAPRLEMPVLWDHAALDAKRIDPAKVLVKLAPAEMFYKRILDKLLFQAHLRGEVRVDEVGTVFYWITR